MVYCPLLMRGGRTKIEFFKKWKGVPNTHFKCSWLEGEETV